MPPNNTDSGVVEFTFPDPAKRLNLNDRLFWAARAGITSAWRTEAHRRYKHLARHDGGTSRALPPCEVHVTFDVPNPGLRRDPSNWFPTIKAIVDGITDAGAWPDDHAEWVTVIEPRFVKGATKRTTVRLVPRA